MLRDIKVLDLSTLLPGPYASMMLADLGAQVLRVEAPDRLDLVRVMPPLVGESSAAHQLLNRNKRSIALDLKTAEGIDIVKRLVAEHDVLLEQFRPGVMARLGLDYETLKAINPRLIYCAITGYGQTGPYADRAGHDLNYLALSGLSDYARRAGEAPVPQSMQIADVAGGSLHSVVGILAALHHRNATGKGQMVDVSMTDAAFSFNAMSGAALLAGGVAPAAEGGMLNGGGFYDYYETADGRYLSVGSLEPKFFAGLCTIIGHEELIPMAADPGAQAHIKATITAAIKAEHYAVWCERFAAQDVCVEPVLSLDEAVCHPHVVARGLVVEVPDANGGAQAQIGCPIAFSGFSPDYRHCGGVTGADSEAVLAELGCDAAEIEALKRAGALGKS